MLIQNPAPQGAHRSVLPATIACLKSPAAPGKGPRPAPGSAALAETVEERLVLCRECRFPVTRQEEQSEMAGARQHTFANPAGIVFTIGCFHAAEGCLAVGPSSDEFTWFPGFSWRVSVCRNCLAHLGWHFASPAGPAFWGLILDHLIFPPT